MQCDIMQYISLFSPKKHDFHDCIPPPEIFENHHLTHCSAATAALYVTHPDRRLSVREPVMADTQLPRE